MNQKKDNIPILFGGGVIAIIILLGMVLVLAFNTAGISILGLNGGGTVVDGIVEINPDGSTIIGSDEGSGRYGLSAVPSLPFVPGRAKSSGGTVFYTVPGVNLTSVVGGTSSVGNVGTHYPWVIYDQSTIDQFALEVTTASGTGGSVARMCIYNADTDWQPEDLVNDYGTVATDTTGLKTLTITPESLSPGRYIMLLVSDATFSARQLGGTIPINAAVGTSAPLRQITDMRFSGFAATTQAQGGCANPGTGWSNFSTGASFTNFHVAARITTP